MDIICSSEGSEGPVEPKLRGSWVLMFSDVGATEKRRRPTIHLRGVLHRVDGCEGSSGVMLTPSVLSVIHSLCVRTFYSLTACSPDLLPSFPHWWWGLSISVHVPFTLRRSICKHMYTYVSAVTCTQSQTSQNNIKTLIRNTCHVGGTSLDPHINTEKNPNIMSSIMRAEKLMNNNSKN